MGVERGPGGGGFEGPRTEYTKIEGKVETSFPEIDIDQATHVPFPALIAWPTAKLTFEPVGTYTMPERFGMSSRVQLYEGQLEYDDKKGEKRKSSLSLITSKTKPVFFTGTTNGFYAHDPLMRGNDYPFYVVGLQPYELQESMTRMSAVYHELGHVLILYNNLDTRLLQAAISLQRYDFPSVAQSRAYVIEVARVLPDSIRKQQPPFNVTRYTLSRLEAGHHDVKKAVSLFHERNAWAAGMNIARGNDYPTGFQKPISYFDYARLCLTSYGNYYRDSRFVRGIKSY